MSPRVVSVGEVGYISTNEGAALVPPTSVGTPAVTIGGAARIPSTTRLVYVDAIVSLSMPDGGVGQVNLEISADGSTNWIAMGRVKNSFDVTGVLGLTGTNIMEQELTAFVPPGWSYRLTSSGSGTKTLVQIRETVM